MAKYSFDFQRANLSASNIYLKYGNLIRKLIYFKVKNEDRADDIFQSFYLHLIINPIPPGVENIDSYLNRMLVNYINENAQQTARYKSYLTRFARRANSVRLKDDPRSAVVNAEQTSNFFTLIGKHLPSRESLAITLRYRDNYDFGEIAEVMAVKTISVRRYIVRGIEKLKNVTISKEIFDSFQ